MFIYLLAKYKTNTYKKSPFSPQVSIVIVACNEESRIEGKIKNCLASDYSKDKLQLIVVSDGSTDKTNDIVSAYANLDSRVSLIKNIEQRGKSACLNDGVAKADSDYVVFCDTRQELDGSAISELMQYFADDDVGAVSGEMFFRDDSVEGYSEGLDFYWKYEKFIRKAESNCRSVVGVTGALYAIKKVYYEPLPQGVILDDVMIPMNIVRQDKRVAYCSSARIYDFPSKDISSEEKRKRRTISGNYQLLKIMPWLLSWSKNPIWFEYLSHKVLRLLSPFLFALFFVVSFCLAKECWFYFLGFVAAFYIVVAALLGVYINSLSSKFWIKVPLGFMSMNYFALMGCLDFLTGKNLGSWKK